MKRGTERARGKLLEAWEPPPNAGDPVAAVATTFSFDAGFFEEELIARFMCLETGPDDGDAYRLEREERLGAVPIVALVDRRHVDRRTTLAWDQLAVSVPYQCCQHAKVTVLAWERATRVIIGSANLTPAGYRRNVETFVVFDFHDAGEVPRSVLTDTLAFLEELVARVSGPMDESDGAVMRARAVIRNVRACTERLDLPDAWARGVVRAEPAFLLPGTGSGVVDQLTRVWGEGARPNRVWLCSPYWGEPDANGEDAVVRAMITQLSTRGESAVDVYAPGEPEQGQRWVAYAPSSILATRTNHCAVAVWPVSATQDDESRHLHAKLTRWFRAGDDGLVRDVLMIGSSNATTAGMGIGGHPRNVEANVIYVSDRTTQTEKWFDACFPEAHGEPTKHLVAPDRNDGEDEGGAPPVPAFFGWASARRVEGCPIIDVGFSLGDDEPLAWVIEVAGLAQGYDKAKHSAAGRPSTWRTTLPADRDLPFEVVVRWRIKDEEHSGFLPINASDAESRIRSVDLSGLGLDMLIDMLGSRGAFYRVLADRMRARSKQGATVNALVMDPHRRVDTTGFLAPRMRRISRALEGLHDRLAAPLHTETALDWRFGGPFGPVAVAKALIGGTADAAEQAFLLVEVMLTLSRARSRVPVAESLRESIHARFNAAQADLRSLVPNLEATPVGAYVQRALVRLGPPTPVTSEVSQP